MSVLDGGGIPWESAYDNRAAVANSAALMAKAVAAAEACRAELGQRFRQLDWGDTGGRQIVDIVVPEGQPVGLAVFIHGGYWHRNDPSVFTHLARGALARGWAVALPGYRLCPEVRIRDIVQDVARGIEAAASEVDGPIRLAGHSAGGHLASRLITAGALSGAVLERVASVLSISGLHDLRPLMRTPLQDVLHLDEAEALAEGPALLQPEVDVPVIAWVGADELPELRRQSALLATIWGGLGLTTRLVEEAEHDHFTVIEGLADPEAPITWAFLGD